jgi:hypothetical protein
MKTCIYSALLTATAFLATPAFAVVTVEVPDVGSFQLIGSGDAAVTYNGVTFSQSAARSNGNFFNVSTGFSSQPAVLSSQQQTIGVPNILIALPEFATSIGIAYGVFESGSVNFLLSNGQSFTQNVTSSVYNTPFTFLSGLTDPFNSVLITSGSGSDVLSIRSVTMT